MLFALRLDFGQVQPVSCSWPPLILTGFPFFQNSPALPTKEMKQSVSEISRVRHFLQYLVIVAVTETEVILYYLAAVVM